MLLEMYNFLKGENTYKKGIFSCEIEIDVKASLYSNRNKMQVKLKQETKNSKATVLKREVFNHNKIQKKIKEIGISEEDAVFVINKSEITNRFNLLQTLLPSCKHHFAIKSCPQDIMLEEWNSLGGYFDIASNGEIELLKKLNVDISKCIHTHPIKKTSEIKFSIDQGIKTFVIDNEDELLKFEPYKNKVNLMLRLSFSSSDATIDLSSKYGMMPNNALIFISNAIIQGYQIVGICFHVGSQMKSNVQYLKALNTCKEIYEDLTSIGIELKILDIGGGFPFHENETIEELEAFFDPINKFLETHFSSVTCFSEPGRFVSSSIATLVCSVIGKSKSTSKIKYYLNEGVYGCLSNKIFDFYDMSQMNIFPNQHGQEETTYSSTFFGPTCDSFDKIIEHIPLPELAIGDCIVFKNLGAYTIASATNFNLLGNINILIID
jgi:ornithine decarboxylase